jgi:hypothetical protein
MPHRSGTLQLFNVMFLTRDLTVIVLSRVLSQAVNISISANNPYRIASLLDWRWRRCNKFAVLA